jgi:ubiquinone/menaquinone biosynthesis C-methylase UbiE
MQHNNLDLIESTKQVFDECAPVYLKEDKHWGCDLDIISEYIERFKAPKVIELGTGYAWHLTNLFFITSANLKRIVGVDYSEKMLERAKDLLSSISYNGRLLIENIELKKGDILSLPFNNESFDVAILLNNTLGNIPAETFDKAKAQRKKALGEIRRILRKSGFLILSVYNSTKLAEEDKYGEVFELDHELSNLETFDLVVRFKQTNTPYYSHCFNSHEICQLLYDVSFKVVEVEERRKRIVVVAQKRN